MTSCYSYSNTLTLGLVLLIFIINCLPNVIAVNCPPLPPSYIYPPVRAPGYCTTYGADCDKPDKQWTTCLNNTQAITASFDVSPTCPELADGPVCCDRSQYEQLELSMAKAANIFGRCPSCYHNFRKFWCQFTCSPDQSMFLTVTDQRMGSLGKMVVNGTIFSVSPEYSTLFWNSCKNVIFGATGLPVVKVLFNADNYLEFFCFQGVPQPQGSSPFLINYQIIDDNQALNNTSSLSPCNSNNRNETCACVDCPSSPLCPLKK